MKRVWSSWCWGGNGSLAQLEEHRAFNPQVVGSNPTRPTIFIALLLSLGCADPPFDRKAFENEWWEVQEYPVCFNFHETGDFLIYTNRINNYGEWEFVEPNGYSAEDKTVYVTADEQCWKIEEYTKNKIIVACECTIFEGTK